MSSFLRSARRTAKALAERVMFARSFTLNGVALRIPIISWSGWDNLSDHEPSVDRLLSRMLEATSGTVVDVGVNTGQILMKVKTK